MGLPLPAPLPEASWEQQLLQQLGVPITNPNIVFLDAWNHAEGNAAGHSGLPINNPFNTTNVGPGSYSVNDKGVQAFPTLQEGLAVTVKTIKPQNQSGWNDYFTAIYAALQSGDPFINVTQDFRNQLDKWGTGSGFLNTTSTGGGTPPGVPGGSSGGIPAPPIKGGQGGTSAAQECKLPDGPLDIGGQLAYLTCVAGKALPRAAAYLVGALLIIVGVAIFIADDIQVKGISLKQAAGKVAS